MKNKGFTLIELLATLIILALITSVVTIVTLNTMQKAKVPDGFWQGVVRPLSSVRFLFLI